MKKSGSSIVFISLMIVLIYIGIVGLVLSKDSPDLISIFLINVIMFILVGCLYIYFYESANEKEGFLNSNHFNITE